MDAGEREDLVPEDPGPEDLGPEDLGPEGLEAAVLDELEAVDDEVPAGTAPLEAARRRRALRSAENWLDSA